MEAHGFWGQATLNRVEVPPALFLLKASSCGTPFPTMALSIVKNLKHLKVKPSRPVSCVNRAKSSYKVRFIVQLLTTFLWPILTLSGFCSHFREDLEPILVILPLLPLPTLVLPRTSALKFRSGGLPLLLPP